MEIGYQGAGSEALASPLPEATLLRLKRHAVIRQFSDGERVPRAGPVGEHVHYIRRGRVRAVLHGPGGQDKILAILDRGALFGESSLVPWSGPNLSFYAAEFTETWSWSHRFVVDLLHDDARVAGYLLASLARKVQLLTAQIHTLTFADAGERVMRTFLHLAKLYGEPLGGGRIRVGLRLTQSDVGDIANTSRVTVNKVCRQLQAERILSKHAGHFIVHDLARLSLRALVGRSVAAPCRAARQDRVPTAPPAGSSGAPRRRS